VPVTVLAGMFNIDVLCWLWHVINSRHRIACHIAERHLGNCLNGLDGRVAALGWWRRVDHPTTNIVILRPRQAAVFFAL